LNRTVAIGATGATIKRPYQTEMGRFGKTETDLPYDPDNRYRVKRLCGKTVRRRLAAG